VAEEPIPIPDAQLFQLRNEAFQVRQSFDVKPLLGVENRGRPTMVVAFDEQLLDVATAGLLEDRSQSCRKGAPPGAKESRPTALRVNERSPARLYQASTRLVVGFEQSRSSFKLDQSFGMPTATSSHRLRTSRGPFKYKGSVALFALPPDSNTPAKVKIRLSSSTGKARTPLWIARQVLRSDTSLSFAFVPSRGARPSNLRLSSHPARSRFQDAEYENREQEQGCLERRYLCRKVAKCRGCGVMRSSADDIGGQIYRLGCSMLRDDGCRGSRSLSCNFVWIC
jgi:hypothetical protein